MVYILKKVLFKSTFFNTKKNFIKVLFSLLKKKVPHKSTFSDFCCKIRLFYILDVLYKNYKGFNTLTSVLWETFSFAQMLVEYLEGFLRSI